MFCLVSYDITDDKRRSRMAKALLDFGDRVQESVFECRLDQAREERMLKRVEKIVTEEDSLRIYFLCSRCETSIKTMGRADQGKTEKVYIV